MKIIFDFGLIFVLMQVNLVVKLEPQKVFWSTVTQVETNMPGFFYYNNYFMLTVH